MNLEHLRELDELFEHRNDALILLCLANAVTEADGRPLHFRELARTIVEQSGTYIADGTLSRSLPRLKDSLLVAVHDEGGRHPAYRPTPLGDGKAAMLTFILDALENRHSERGKDSTEPFSSVHVRACRSGDVELLERYAPSPGGQIHGERYARQVSGASTFLLAWLDDQPVGSGELRWSGCDAEAVQAAYPDCPELNGLAVWPPELRSRGIGTALITAAENLVRERGYPRLGLGVADDNPRAATLYARLGYQGKVRYLDQWSHLAETGARHDHADRCTFLVKELKP